MRLPITVAAALLVFSAGLASAVNNPIPGLPMVDERPPPRHDLAKTGKDGKFVVEKVPPAGKILLSLDLEKVKAIAGTTKAWVKHTKSAVNGVEVHEIIVTFDKAAPTTFRPVEVEVGAKGGRIVGAIYHEVPEKKDKK